MQDLFHPILVKGQEGLSSVCLSLSSITYLSISLSIHLSISLSVYLSFIYLWVSQHSLYWHLSLDFPTCFLRSSLHETLFQKLSSKRIQDGRRWNVSLHVSGAHPATGHVAGPGLILLDCAHAWPSLYSFSQPEVTTEVHLQPTLLSFIKLRVVY